MQLVNMHSVLLRIYVNPVVVSFYYSQSINQSIKCMVKKERNAHICFLYISPNKM